MFSLKLANVKDDLHSEFELLENFVWKSVGGFDFFKIGYWQGETREAGE